MRADGVHAVAAEQAHEVVFERQVELRGARVALTAGTAAQLVVDAARLVALGADDGEAAGRDDAGRARRRTRASPRRARPRAARRWARGPRLRSPSAGRSPGSRSGSSPRSRSTSSASTSGLPPSRMSVPRPAMFVAMVTAPTRPACAMMCASRSWFFAFKRLVLDAALVEQARELLGAFDGHGADEAGLARRVALGHVVGHGVELRLHRAVDEVVLVLSGDRAVRRDGHDRQLVDLAELGVLGHGRAGHAGELLVEAEVVLQRDGGQRLVLLAHEHALLGLERLVQALGVAAALHDAAGELVDDLHLAVHHDVVHVAVEQELRLERLLQVVRPAGRTGRRRCRRCRAWPRSSPGRSRWR